MSSPPACPQRKEHDDRGHHPVTWLRIDDGFVEHPKVASLSDQAFRLHLVGLSYCARNLTDGTLDERATRIVGASVCARPGRLLTELEQVGLWDRAGDGYLIHDYLDWNPAASQVKKERRRAADRQKKARGGKPKSHGVSHGVTSGVTDAVTNGVSHAVPSLSRKNQTPRTVTAVSRGPANGDGQVAAVSTFGNELAGDFDRIGAEATAAIERLRAAAESGGVAL
jgi:hypothetical protein